MKNKIEVIENLGVYTKKPLGGRGHYEIQKVKYKGFYFFRRQKINNGKVSSKSYASEINAKCWLSKYEDVIKTLTKQ